MMYVVVYVCHLLKDNNCPRYSINTSFVVEKYVKDT